MPLAESGVPIADNDTASAAKTILLVKQDRAAVLRMSRYALPTRGRLALALPLAAPMVGARPHPGKIVARRVAPAFPAPVIEIQPVFRVDVLTEETAVGTELLLFKVHGRECNRPRGLLWS